jgi:RNA polymerase sigma-70 factor, ECF subfamily
MIAQAARGDAPAREALLGLYRPYLRLVAGQRMPRVLRKRADASDIVQQALIDADRGLPEFRGQSEPELTSWMLKLLERNLLQSVRKNTLGKRDVRLELDWSDGDGSAALAWQTLAADGSSPINSVIRGEAALRLAAAIEKLREDQRMAVELRYIGQKSLRAIADEMERSVGSVAGLIRRGVEALQDHLPSELGEISA